ncbi:hypothetical protein BU15DRAFT_28137, partial [Melanogaster broomeanus]
WDILTLQEPYIDPRKNTISTCRFHVVYPTTRYNNHAPKSRAALLISTSLDSNSWSQLPFPSPDVVVIQVTGNFSCCTIFNIY